MIFKDKIETIVMSLIISTLVHTGFNAENYNNIEKNGSMLIDFGENGSMLIAKNYCEKIKEKLIDVKKINNQEIYLCSDNIKMRTKINVWLNSEEILLELQLLQINSKDFKTTFIE